jgi:hypothetical protein
MSRCCPREAEQQLDVSGLTVDISSKTVFSCFLVEPILLGSSRGLP